MNKYKLASIDIETLGLDAENCNIIEFGCVLDDFRTPLDQLPRFRRLLYPKYSQYNGTDWVFKGEAYAMALNASLLKELADFQSKPYPYPGPNGNLDSWAEPEHELDSSFWHWLVQLSNPSLEMEPINIVGKNFANFDLLFLKKIGFGRRTKYHRRILDVGSLYYDPTIDNNVPGLDECLKRAGIEKQVQHTSIDDALDVLKCVRYKYGIV